jgi:hypothetical protein
MFCPRASFASVITAGWLTAAKATRCPCADRPWDKWRHRHPLSQRAWRSGYSSGRASTSHGVPPVGTSPSSVSRCQRCWAPTQTETHRPHILKKPSSVNVRFPSRRLRLLIDPHWPWRSQKCAQAPCQLASAVQGWRASPRPMRCWHLSRRLSKGEFTITSVHPASSL